METSSLAARVLTDNSFINSRYKYVIFLHIISELLDYVSGNFQLNSLSLIRLRVSKIFSLLRKAPRVNKRIILRPTALSLRPTALSLRPTGSFTPLCMTHDCLTSDYLTCQGESADTQSMFRDGI